MGRGARISVIVGVSGGMLCVVGYGAYNVLNATIGTGTASAVSATPRNTSPPDAAEVRTTAQGFLTAWAAGDPAKAAGLTDSVQTATAALKAYRDTAHVTSVTLAPGTPVGVKVPFAVTAGLSYGGRTSTWSYDSSLTVVRRADGEAAVAWTPSVLHPKLSAGTTLVTGRAAAAGVAVVDRDGRAMDPADHPSLVRIFDDLGKRYGSELTGGTPGVETWVAGPDGAPVTTLHVLDKGKGARLRTTLDSAMQKAAEQAVLKESRSGVTAVDIRTGAIRAIAYNPANGTDLALQSQVAPGSTFKVVTAAALMLQGMTPDSPAPCRKSDNFGYGKMYTNVTRANPDATLAWDFTRSCNTGFITRAGRLPGSTLPDTARRYFGLNTVWNAGTPVTDPKVPGGSGDELTSEMIGQGRITVSPLAMASVAATATDGRFHQPYLIDPGLIDGRVPIDTAPLPSRVRSGLRRMMRQTVTGGTAFDAMRGVPGDTGAKTGSAEAGDDQPNAWFIGYRGDVAAGAVVLEGGHGGDSAGPMVASVLRAS